MESLENQNKIKKNIAVLFLLISLFYSCKENSKAFLYDKFNYKDSLVTSEFCKISVVSDTNYKFISKDTTIFYIEKNIKNRGIYRNCFGLNKSILCYSYNPTDNFTTHCIEYSPIFNLLNYNIKTYYYEKNIKVHKFIEHSNDGENVIYTYLLEDFGVIAYVLPYEYSYVIINTEKIEKGDLKDKIQYSISQIKKEPNFYQLPHILKPLRIE